MHFSQSTLGYVYYFCGFMAYVLTAYLASLWAAYRWRWFLKDPHENVWNQVFKAHKKPYAYKWSKSRNYATNLAFIVLETVAITGLWAYGAYMFLPPMMTV